MSALQQIEVRTLRGDVRSLQDFAGNAWLIVNVASQCGFTPQYAGLEALYRRFKDRGLVVLGFPCNQFGQQEPGDANQISEFCALNYGVSFPMFAKIDVNGPQTHPLYEWLKQAAPGLLGSRAIKWNFTKFLVDPSSESVRRYAPNTKPEELLPDIEALLPQA